MLAVPGLLAHDLARIAGFQAATRFPDLVAGWIKTSLYGGEGAARTAEDGAASLEFTVVEGEDYWAGVAAGDYEVWMRLFDLAGEAVDRLVDRGETELAPT